MLGPKQQQLKAYIENANEDSLDSAGDQWRQGEQILRQLATELRSRGDNIGGDDRFTGDTATKTVQAFHHSSQKMQDRADQMRDGSLAFHRAATAVRSARTQSNQFDKHAGDQPPTKPADNGDAKAQSEYQTQNTQFWNQYGDRETEAGAAIEALTKNHTEQAEVFQRIHGEAPPPPPGGGGGQNPVTSGTAPTPTHVPGGGRVPDPGDPTLPPPKDPGVPPVDGPGNPPGNPPGTPPTGIPDPGNPPTTTRPPTATPPVGVPTGPGVPAGGVSPTSPLGGVGAGTTGGLGAVGGVGAATGGALGGAAAAGLAGGLAGGLNGGLNGLMPVAGAGGRGGLSSSGVRGIGSTARGAGSGSVLGRGAGATGSGRTGAGGTGSRGRGAGRGGVGGRGSRGSAGSRNGVGAGGSGRGGKDQKRRGEERDLFDDGKDWLDDEDAAPGLLD